jgi:putative membrane protein
MKLRFLSAALLLMLAGACRERAGLPQTETTGTAQVAGQNTTATVNTTEASGGNLSDMTPDDKEFVSKAGMAGLAEMQMANLALQKTSNADVKAFAQRVITDHSKSNAELAEFATTKGLALPTELAAESKAGFDHLESLNGAEFDKAYMQHMVEDHQKAVALFQNASANATDPDLKAWAGRTLPTLQAHLQLAGKM